MITLKETYDYCEELIEEQLTITLKELDKETDPFLKQELKDLYKHLENIQIMKVYYLSGNAYD